MAPAPKDLAESTRSALGQPTARSKGHPCDACWLRDLEATRAFSAEEMAFVKDFRNGGLSVEAGATLLEEGQSSPFLYTVRSGWAIRFKLLPDGRRQIVNVALPGDLLGLQVSLFDVMEHSVQALTDMTLCCFPREKVMELYREQPNLGFDLTWLCAREERFLDSHLLSLGRRTAVERMAYLILFLHDRLQPLGLVQGNDFHCPLTQSHLADSLGLSLVHTNKTLRRLSQEGLITWTSDRIYINDMQRLRDAAKQEESAVALRPFL